MKRLLILAGILIGISAFFYFQAHTPKVPELFTATLPGRDELCSSGKIRLSMNSFEAIRRRFPGVAPLDQVRIGLYAQWLREKSDGQDPALLGDAARCVRALLKPSLSSAEMNEIESLLGRRFGVFSLKELRQLINDAWRGRAVEWNQSLVKEYGIESPESLGNSG